MGAQMFVTEASMQDAARTAYASVAGALPNARALPWAAFSDPQVFAAEVREVLHAGWLPVARESDLVRVGDYRSVDLAGVPLVVTRDATGQVHVISRVCRHRGALVIEGAGNAKAFTCPYHLWRYGLDGRLAAAAGMERSEAFEREQCRLPAVRTTHWGGWVFANLDGRADPLEAGLSGLADRLAEVNPAGMVTADVISLDSPWNWKLMIENFLESYHHIGPHSASLQQTNPGLGAWVRESADLYTVLENPPAEGHDPFVVAAIFPATLMFFTEGPEPVGVWYELDGIEHQRFRLRIHLLASPDLAAAPEFVEQYRQQVMAVHVEDIAACEVVQKGVMSPLYEPGPLSHLEASLWRFHRFLQARLGADSARAP
jgi:phenylpropionate dioxygenase-like ring-hydroxylating dioxygenase large terminal subunit